MLPDPRHFEILRRGPRAWNAWREQNPSTLPLLMEVTLTLSERQLGPINGGPINLASACLRDTFLRFAALTEADLEAADLSQADLVHARLDRANFTAANLSNAILDHADFADAKLSGANLNGASLNHAQNLTQAQINESIGNNSTILPPHLKPPESWLKTRDVPHTSSPPTYAVDFSSQDRSSLDIFQAAVIPKLAWKVGALICGAVFVAAGVGWQQGTSLDRPRLETAKRDAGQAKAKATEFARAFATLNSELEKANAQRNELQTKLDQATSEVESAQSQLKDKQPYLERMQSELETAKRDVEQAKAQATEFASSFATLNSELEKSNAQRNELQTKLDQATSEVEFSPVPAQGQATFSRANAKRT